MYVVPAIHYLTLVRLSVQPTKAAYFSMAFYSFGFKPELYIGQNVSSCDSTHVCILLVWGFWLLIFIDSYECSSIPRRLHVIPWLTRPLVSRHNFILFKVFVHVLKECIKDFEFFKYSANERMSNIVMLCWNYACGYIECLSSIEECLQPLAESNTDRI